MNVLEKSPLSIDMFFILSGFLIGGILLPRPAIRRTITGPSTAAASIGILPFYYAWIAFFCGSLLCRSRLGLGPPQGYSGAFCLLSFAFLFQNFFPAIIESTFIVAPTWTLVVEEHFYLLAPLCVRRMTGRRLIQSLFAVILVAPIFRAVLFKYIGHRSDWADIATRIWPPCRADALAMGVLLAVVWSSASATRMGPETLGSLHLGDVCQFWICGSDRLDGWRELPLLPLSAMFLWAVQAVEFACFCLIVYLICRPHSGFGRFLSSSVMREMGKISYCLYVIHWGVFWIIFRFVLHARFGERLWVDFSVIPIALLISIGIAQLSWKYFEHPLLQRAHRVPPPVPVAAIPGQQAQIA